MTLKLLIIFIIAFIGPSIAAGGEWHLIPGGSRSALFFEGSIEDGDASGLVEHVNIDKSINAIFFESPGGSLDEGIRLARIIDRLDINTVVLSGRQCASACTVAYMGGKQRFAEPDAMVEIHAPYRMQDASPDAFLNPMGRLERDFGNLEYRKFLTQFSAKKNISKEFIDLMFAYDDPSSAKKIGLPEGLSMGYFTDILN